jgi:hypothetical protein
LQVLSNLETPQQTTQQPQNIPTVRIESVLLSLFLSLSRFLIYSIADLFYFLDVAHFGAHEYNNTNPDIDSTTNSCAHNCNHESIPSKESKYTSRALNSAIECDLFDCEGSPPL